MSVAAGPVGLDPAAARRAVRAERAEVVRWRRLLRARLDLLVATYAPPESLGDLAWDIAPHREITPDLSDALRAALGDTPDGDRVAAMRRVRDLDRRLSCYADHLDRALEASTEQLVMDLVHGELTRCDELV
ncbi:MAG TPA: hypothetical protein PKB06_08155 [Actinotalea sp.]|nr:hypothetical protein [Actinotalea sp.]